MGSGRQDDQEQQILRDVAVGGEIDGVEVCPSLEQLYRDLVLTAGEGKPRHQGRRDLVTMLQQQLTSVDHTLWLEYPEAQNIVAENVTGRQPGWEPHAAMGALTRLEQMIWHLWDEPWKMEIRCMKLQIGHFQYHIARHLLGYESLCHLMGYLPIPLTELDEAEGTDAIDFDTGSVLVLDEREEGRLCHAAVVVLVCFAEFSIYQAVYDLVHKVGGTLLDVHQCRCHHILAVEDCVRDVMDRYDSVSNSKKKEPHSKHKDKKIRDFLLRKSHSEDRPKVKTKSFKFKLYGFPSAPSSRDPLEVATKQPAVSQDANKAKPWLVTLEGDQQTTTGGEAKTKLLSSATQQCSIPNHFEGKGSTSKVHNILNKLNKIKPDLRNHGDESRKSSQASLWVNPAAEAAAPDADDGLVLEMPPEGASGQPTASHRDNGGHACYWAEPTFSTFRPSSK